MRKSLKKEKKIIGPFMK